MQDDFNLRTVERIAALETDQEHIAQAVQKHDELIVGLKKDMDTLVGEVKSIRYALWFIGGALGLNIPLKDISAMILKVLGMG